MQGPGCSHSSTRTREVSPLSLDDYRSVIESIYQNQYFTNHGPLAKQFESELETYLGIENVVCIGNESLALLIAIAGLEIQGEIVIPALAGHLPNQIANWLNLEVRFCDANEKTNQPTMQEISAALSERTEAIVLIETWGQRCDQQLIETLIACGLKIVIVAFESFGAMSSQGYVAHHPNVTTVFSFGYGKTLSTIQGGAIATASNEVAERFRNTRSSYGVREKRNVKATCNGRFSELQAAASNIRIKENAKVFFIYSIVLRI
jgi:dTDP-4-amino-4,6-dideoxygalactose transaminase